MINEKRKIRTNVIPEPKEAPPATTDATDAYSTNSTKTTW